MSELQHNPPTIKKCDPRHFGAALWLATRTRSPRESRGRVTAWLAAEKQGKLSFDGLFTAHREDRMAAAAWTTIQPGAVATLWGPGMSSAEPESTASEMVERSIEFAKTRRAELIQALVPTEGESSRARHLSSSGLQPVTDIIQLSAFPIDRPSIIETPELEFVGNQSPSSSLFSDAVKETYVQSFDCPELDGVRSISNVLLGYLATSEGCTQHWYQVIHHQKLAGVVLLSHHTAIGQLELVYFGLAPKYRGQGLGQSILQFVMKTACQLRCQMVLTSVDARNIPAMDVYRKIGFGQTTRNTYYMADLHNQQSAVA